MIGALSTIAGIERHCWPHHTRLRILRFAVAFSEGFELLGEAMTDNRTQVFDVAMKNARTIEACVDRLSMMGADHELKLVAQRLSRLTFRLRSASDYQENCGPRHCARFGDRRLDEWARDHCHIRNFGVGADLRCKSCRHGMTVLDGAARGEGGFAIY
jgi:hypothetical protein